MEDVETIRIILSQNLKAKRKSLKINQDELAERSRLSTTYIKNIERGVSWPSPESFEALANGLGITVEELLRDGASAAGVPKLSPLNRVLSGLMNIPQDVYEMIEQVEQENEAWDTVRAALEIAIEKKQSHKNEKSV